MDNTFMPLSNGTYRHVGRSDERIAGEDQTILPRLWREMRGEIARDYLSDNLEVPRGAAIEDLNWRSCGAVTGRMPIGWHIVAVCYATAVILLGTPPWNVLLILLLLPGGNNRLRFRALDTKRERSL